MKKGVSINLGRKKAVLITMVYLLFGALWILLSDSISSVFLNDLNRFVTFSLFKGFIYVGLTGILIFLLVYHAISKIEQVVQDSKNNESLLKALIDSIPDLIFYKDKDSKYIGCNHAFEEFAGIKKEDLIGKSDLELFEKDRAESYLKADREIFESRKAQLMEYTYIKINGEEGIYETLKAPYYDEKSELIGMIGISRDVTESRQRESEILYLNHHDVLTGLYNRAYIQQALDLLDQEINLPISVVVGDINGLRMINESFGHAEGDRLLIAIAGIFKESTRESDVVGRVGGDGFYLILPNTDNSQVKKIVESILINCEKHSKAKDNDVHFTSISLGQETKTEMGAPLREYIQAAEKYMYQQKMLDYKSVHSSLLISIKNTMYEKSNETEEHAERMGQQALMLGKLMDMSEEELVAIQLLANVHDIGKISIDKQILTKKEKLTEEDWLEIRKHPETGYRIANSSPGLKHIAEHILSHHEWWNGSGYPKGLVGEEIPLASRILSIVDAYDAMVHDRAYRKACSKDEALQELKRCSGTQFDPELVRLFAEHLV